MSPEIAFARRLSNLPLTATGKVIKILPDDIEGIQHQRFILEIHSSHTILVANNLERAYRVPVKVGDRVEVHGTYVWNKYGGLIHKTHHFTGECFGPYCEPHEDGYINFIGKKTNPHQEFTPNLIL